MELDPLLQCMVELEKKLKDREPYINYFKEHNDRLLRMTANVAYNGTLIASAAVFNQANVKHVNVQPDGETLNMDSSQLNDQVNDMLEELKQVSEILDDIVYKSVPGTIEGELVVLGDLEIENGYIDQLNISKINDKPFQPDKLLTYSGEQVITGAVTVDTLITDKLYAESMNGKLLSGK